MRLLNHYEILGVARDATLAEIETAYKKLARKHHPDVNGSPASLRMMQTLNDLLMVLSDPVARAQYDAAITADETEDAKCADEYMQPPSGSYHPSPVAPPAESADASTRSSGERKTATPEPPPTDPSSLLLPRRRRIRRLLVVSHLLAFMVPILTVYGLHSLLASRYERQLGAEERFREHLARSYSLLLEGQFQVALAEATQATQLDPDDPIGFQLRGWAWFGCRQYGAAVEDFNLALRIAPRDPALLTGRGSANFRLKKFGLAIEDCEQAIRLAPDDESGYATLACFLSTCPDPKFRDGKRAMDLATKACSITAWADADSLDSLAAACADQGDFAAAAKHQAAANKDEKFLRLGRLMGEDPVEKLMTYRRGKPYRYSER